MSFPKHAEALAHASDDLEHHVQEVPLGGNTGPRVREMQHHTWLGGTGWPWCVAACITWAEEAGFKLPYQGAGAWAFLDWAKKAGWAVPLHKAIPGDFIVWNIGSGHMSMLTSAVGGGMVETIDGNVSDRVDRRSRPQSQVRGAIHLPEEHAVKPAKPPLFEVIGSESGHKKIYVSTAGRVASKLPQILKNHPLGVTIRRRKKKG